MVDLAWLELHFDDLSTLHMMIDIVRPSHHTSTLYENKLRTYSIVDMAANDEAFSTSRQAVLNSDDITRLKNNP